MIVRIALIKVKRKENYSMSQSIRWTPVCIYCGMSRGGTLTTSNGRPPTCPPTMPGICPSSPDKKHKPRWEEC